MLFLSGILFQRVLQYTLRGERMRNISERLLVYSDIIIYLLSFIGSDI